MPGMLRAALALLLLANNLMAQDCADPGFIKFYGRLLNTEYAGDVVSTPDNGSIAVGHAGNNGRSSDALVIRLDQNGNIIWKKQWGLETTGDRFNRVIHTKDDNYLAMGYMLTDNNRMRLWVVKFDITGSLKFSKFIPLPGGIASQGFDICETSDGGFAISGGKQTVPNISESIIIRLNSNAEVMWTRACDNHQLNSGTTFASIIEDQGYLIVAGYISYEPSYHKDGLILKLNSVTGELTWQRIYNIDNLPIRFNDILEKNGIYYINASRTTNQGFDNLQQCVIELNRDGSVKKGIRLDPSIKESFEYHSLIPQENGGYITTQSDNYNIGKDILLFKISAAGGIEWKKKYTQTNQTRIFRIKQSTNKGVIGVGNIMYSDNNPPELFILKTNDKGEAGDCRTFDPPLQIFPVSHTSSAGTILLYPFTFNSEQALFNIWEPDLKTYTTCAPVLSACSIQEILGATAVCTTVQANEYYAVRSEGCVTPVKWELNEDEGTIISSTDSTVKIIFKKSGIAEIRAGMGGDCNINMTVTSVTVKSSPGKVDLGPDLRLCSMNSLTITGVSGFESYQWNDGSSQKDLVVSAAGMYSVHATDACGNTFMDDIEVLAAEESFDLGPDRTVCDNDTLMIRLPVGLTVAGWHPDYQSTIAGNDAIIVAPKTDTSYFIKALFYAGCIKTDTVHVSVRKHLPLMLGQDTGICQGQPLMLTAQPGFSGFLWSDNSTGSSVTVSGKNTFWLHATAPNGCISRDTINVTATYPLPVINISNQHLLCENSQLRLEPGNNFARYNWQNGSSLSSLVVTTPGKYWVEVTDQNGCRSSDTTTITGYIPAPKNFLQKLSSNEICENGKPLELLVDGNWSSYLWSTGSTSRSYRAIVPGTYSLEVTNSSNCRGKDSVVIVQKKDCLAGLYFPNAFTPNNDGKNDVFRPVYSILPVSYHLIIFDRYGGKIFDSMDAAQGWTGSRNGILQGSNSYAWSCKYKLPNGEFQALNGTVTLVR